MSKDGYLCVIYCFCSLVFLRLFFTKESFLKNQQHKYSGCDGGICNIEHRAEENKLLPAIDGEPMRQGGLDDWKVKHIHHFSVQKRTIATVGWKKCCHGMVTAVTEDHSIEGAVDDIPQCPGEDQGEAYNQAGV